MRDRALTLEQDPASDRLTQEQIINIHQDHRARHPWDDIAHAYGISRKQVQRIVQGRRWSQYHPINAPHLYDDAPVTPAPTYTAEQVAQAWQDAREAFFRALE
jgi:hypothetical protein